MTNEKNYGLSWTDEHGFDHVMRGTKSDLQRHIDALTEIGYRHKLVEF